MKLKVDADKCTGHGRCYTLSSDVFEPDDEGLNAAAGTTFEVPSGLETMAMAGVDNCPEQAITVVG